MCPLKLKTRTLNKIIDVLSGREIDFLLYLVKRQTTIGCVDGVYYKDVMDDLYMPKSTFYAALLSLQDEGFIYLRDLDNGVGFNIFIYDNSFLTEGDFKEGYLNINLEFILSETFILLCVNLKKFFLRMLGLQAGTKPVKMLKDTLKRYKVNKLMDELSEMFIITPDGDGYFFKIKPKLLKKGEKNELHLSYVQKLKSYCRSYKINYTLGDLIDSAITTTNAIVNGRLRLFHKALDAILKKKSLEPRLITYICFGRGGY